MFRIGNAGPVPPRLRMAAAGNPATPHEAAHRVRDSKSPSGTVPGLLLVVGTLALMTVEAGSYCCKNRGQDDSSSLGAGPQFGLS